MDSEMVEVAEAADPAKEFEADEPAEELEGDEPVEGTAVDGHADQFEVEWFVEGAEAEQGVDIVGWRRSGNSSKKRASSVVLEYQKIGILDQYRSCMVSPPSVEETIAENGKLVDQRGMFHQYCEACIHMASLVY